MLLNVKFDPLISHMYGMLLNDLRKQIHKTISFGREKGTETHLYYNIQGQILGMHHQDSNLKPSVFKQMSISIGGCPNSQIKATFYW